MQSTPVGVRRTAVAAPNALAAQAGIDLAALGGTAVDAAVAAMAVTLVTEPGIVSSLGGGFVSVWPSQGDPVVVDGNAEMPGRGLSPDRLGGGITDVWLDYGGGISVHAGAGSVATPGAYAALEEAHTRYGRAPWREVLAPAIDAARHGFRVGAAAASYLAAVGTSLFSFDPGTGRLLVPDGVPLVVGARLVDPQLADSLQLIADEGTAVLYGGSLGERVAEHVQELGGVLTLRDLAEYTAVVRPATRSHVGDWEVATNPPPSIGGPVLAAMLRLGEGHPVSAERVADIQRRVLGARRDRLDAAEDLEGAGSELLRSLDALDLDRVPGSPNTAHVSAVDEDGVACAITCSSGYSSGVTVPGTGLLLNNSLGEPELNRRGLHALPAGTRVASNMAPTTARRRDGATLAIGSPGADRITTALQQTLARFFAGAPLQQAVDAPRLHVQLEAGDRVRVEHEPDDEVATMVTRHGYESALHPPVAMYFGGVGAALASPDGELSAAADPRRAAATAVG